MALPARHGKHKETANTRRDTSVQTEEHERGLAPQRWEPWTELERVNRQLEGYLDLWRRGATDWMSTFKPPADLEETDDAYLVEIELAGVQRDDLDIEIGGRQLTVRGERKEKERVGILRRRDRVVGRFEYEVTLPGDVVEDDVSADLVDGVLTVRLPKPASERPRRIAVR